MWFALAVGLVAATVVIILLVNRASNRLAEQRRAELADWGDWTVEQRQEVVLRNFCDQIDSDALRWKTTVGVGSAILLGAVAMVTYIAVDNERLSDLATEVCRSNHNDLVEREAALTSDIRQLEQRRDNAAEEIDVTPDLLAEIPGYTDLPEAVQVFLDGLIQSQIVEAEALIAEWDAELADMRNRVDELRAAISRSDCPG